MSHVPCPFLSAGDQKETDSSETNNNKTQHHQCKIYSKPHTAVIIHYPNSWFLIFLFLFRNGYLGRENQYKEKVGYVRRLPLFFRLPRGWNELRRTVVVISTEAGRGVL